MEASMGEGEVEIIGYVDFYCGLERGWECSSLAYGRSLIVYEGSLIAYGGCRVRYYEVGKGRGGEERYMR